MNVTSRTCSDRMANQSWNCPAEEQKWSENGQWPAVILHTGQVANPFKMILESAATSNWIFVRFTKLTKLMNGYAIICDNCRESNLHMQCNCNCLAS